MLEKIIVKDNNVDNFVPITPTKPQTGYIHKEESQQFGSFEYNYDGILNIPQTSVADTYSEVNHRKGLNSDIKDIPVVSANSATDYIGIVKYDIPHIINETFADFLLIDVQTNPFSTLATSNIESLATPLYDVGDLDPKVISLFNGLQALRIPINRLDDITAVSYTHLTLPTID
jgi:hypothetical protein